MIDLRISKALALPVDTVTQAVAILAKRRMGKSYLARRLAEQLAGAGQQLCILDPKGDWWGIRSSADGKSDGLPILIIGGEHGDIPLDAGAGEIIAKLVVEETVSVLLDLSELRKHEIATFMAVFLETLYRLKAREQFRTPLMVIADEADALAPQKPAPNEARMLGAFSDLVRRGGQRGIGVTFITQRSAVLSKDVLTQAQILIALRVIAPQDLAAIKAWVDVHGTIAEQKTLMGSLPSLPVGDAWVWSPGWPTDGGIFQRIHTLPITTFDSGATPKPGQRAAAPKRLADIDLTAVKRQMADTLERAKADDPKALRARVAELERQIASVKPATMLSEQERMAVEEANRNLGQISAALGKVVAALEGPRREIELSALVVRGVLEGEFAPRGGPIFVPTMPPASASAPTVESSYDPETQRVTTRVGARPLRPEQRAILGKGEAAILTEAAIRHPMGVTPKALTILTGYRKSSRDAYVGRLVAAGFAIRDGASVHATAEGRAALGDALKPLPTGKALREHWRAKLPGGESLIFDCALRAYPNAVSRETISKHCSYKKSSRDAYILRLIARGLVTRQGRDGVRASEDLF